MLKKKHEYEEKRQLRNAAFIVWNLAGSDKSYESYLSSLGLLEKSKDRMKKPLKEKIACEAHSNAKKILDMLSKKERNA
jgi:hypothetical protein